VEKHTQEETTTCKECDPPAQFKNVSAYWRHLRCVHGISSAGRLHPLKRNSRLAEMLHNDNDENETPKAAQQQQQQARKRPRASAEKKNWWEDKIPARPDFENKKVPAIEKPKPGQVAAKRPRSIFRSLAPTSPSEEEAHVDNLPSQVVNPTF
jgi:hypothetical protein